MNQQKLTFTESELAAECPGLKPYCVAGQLFHGGLDSKGEYVSPRSPIRHQGIRAWRENLETLGGSMFPISELAYQGPQFPNFEQHRYLLRHGVIDVFRDELTVTGKLEARGKILSSMVLPDLSELFVEDVSTMAIGHLDRGLLKLHGMDEGSTDEVGGHDQMWFAIRDLLFGKNCFSDAEPPESIAMPDDTTRWMPSLPEHIESYFKLLLNLLLVEVRAELGFARVERMLQEADLFKVSQGELEVALDLVRCIRQDEVIHVESLRLCFGELSRLHLRSGEQSCRNIVIPYWNRLLVWNTEQRPRVSIPIAKEKVRALLDVRSKDLWPGFAQLET